MSEIDISNELKRKIEDIQDNDDTDKKNKKLKENEETNTTTTTPTTTTATTDKADTEDIKDTKDTKDYHITSLPSDLKPTQKVLNDPIFGHSGLLFTFFNGKENQASSDLFNLLEEYVLDDTKKESEDRKDSDDFDFNAAFQKELNQVKEAKTNKSLPYKKFTLKCNGIAFMGFKENSNINPMELTSKIFKDCETSKSIKSKFISRLIPISKLIHLSNLIEEMKILIKQNFLGEKIYTYKIEFKSRNNSSVSRMEYIKEIAKLIDRKHVVDLIDPQLTIIVEIINFYCAISIVSNYNQCKRFNMSGLAGLSNATTPKNKKNKDEKKE